MSDFKEGMRRMASSVCLITTRRADGERFGLAATAVCSLSADPAMLLCCLNRLSHTYGATAQSQAFCVNVLAVEDAVTAHHFASDRPAAEKFAVGDWSVMVTGAPSLGTALAAFDCMLDRMVEAASHVIMIGAVKAITLTGGERRPLLYAQGGYGRFTAQDAQATLTAS